MAGSTSRAEHVGARSLRVLGVPRVLLPLALPLPLPEPLAGRLTHRLGPRPPGARASAPGPEPWKPERSCTPRAARSHASLHVRRFGGVGAPHCEQLARAGLLEARGSVFASTRPSSRAVAPADRRRRSAARVAGVGSSRRATSSATRPTARPQSGAVSGELARERRRDPADALAGLEEVGGGERSLGQESQDVAVDERPDGLHEVGRERVAVELVGVEDAEPGVEPDDPRRERRLRPRGSRRGSSGSRSPGCSASRGPPVSGDVRLPSVRQWAGTRLDVAPGEPDRTPATGRPVGAGRHRLGQPDVVAAAATWSRAVASRIVVDGVVADLGGDRRRDQRSRPGRRSSRR